MDQNKKILKKSKQIPFWSHDPNVLIQPQYITELFPISTMTYNQQLNAITRLVLLVSICLFIWSPKISIVIVLLIVLGIIFVVHQSKLFYTKINTNTEKNVTFSEESFSNIENEKEKLEYSNNSREYEDEYDDPTTINTDITINKYEDSLNESELPFPNMYDKITPQNPFCNVLATDYVDNPSKLPAGPDFDPNVQEQIINATKQMTDIEHNTQPNFSNQLYRSVGDELSYAQSMRQFYSAPNTTIPGDQKEMLDYFYGGMVSCKEGNGFACEKSMAPRQGLV